MVAQRGSLRCQDPVKEDLLDLKTLRSLEKEAASIEDYLKKRRV